MTDPARPLTGLRVLDLTQALSGPFATCILADLGADVLKVESPRGDLTRSTPPHYVDGTSVYFLANNRNKRGMVLDLKSAEGLQTFLRLVGQVDVVINNFADGVADRLGVGYEAVRDANPRAVYCAITGYGAMTGQESKRAVDLVVQAAAGAMSITGYADRPPARAGVPTADMSAGLYAVIGILAALRRRDETGEGCRVDTTLFHSQLSLLNYVATYAAVSGVSPAPFGSGHAGTVPSQVFETADGWIAIDAGFDRHFASLCRVLGLAELADDPRFATRPARSDHRGELLPLLEQRLRTRGAEEWCSLLDADEVPCSPVNDVLRSVELGRDAAQPVVDDVEAGSGSVTVFNTPIWLDGSSSHGRLTPAPALGEHTQECLDELLGQAADTARGEGS